MKPQEISAASFRFMGSKPVGKTGFFACWRKTGRLCHCRNMQESEGCFGPYGCRTFALGSFTFGKKSEKERLPPRKAFFLCSDFLSPVFGNQGSEDYSARLLTASMTALVVMVAPAMASISAESTGRALPTNWLVKASSLASWPRPGV